MATEAQQRERVMERVFARIDRARASWRAVEAGVGLLKVLLVCGAASVVGFAADNLIHLPAAARLGYGLAVLGLFVVMLVRLVAYPLLRPITDEMVAAHLERYFPELDNHLINSVLLYGERFGDAVTRRMAAAQLRETVETVGRGEFGRGREARALWRFARWDLALAAALALYGVLFSAHLGNAFLRFLHPYSPIPPITDTRLKISPGHAQILQGDPLAVEARVSGLLPQQGRIETVTGDERAEDAMAFEGNAFTYGFVNIQTDFTYRVRAGDALTPWYRVTVRSRPAVTGLTITYAYPRYTGLPETIESGGTGDIRAPVGTTARLRVATDRPVRRGRIEVDYLAPSGQGEPAEESLPLVGDGETDLRGEMAVTRSGRYTISIEDHAGVPNVPQVRHVEAVPDAAPRVDFVKPGKDVAVSRGADVTLLATAEDDFSVRGLHLFVQRRGGAEWEKLASWDYEAGARLAREGAVLDTEQLGLGVGDVLAYYMRANDGLRRQDETAGRSRIYHVRVVGQEEAAGGAAGTREALRDVIKRLIEMQKANLAATRDLGTWVQGREALDDPNDEAWDEFRERAGDLVDGQEGIYRRASEAVMEYAADEKSSLTEALGRIAAGPIATAIDLLRDLEAAPERALTGPRAHDAARQQAEVIALLAALLEDPAGLLASMIEQEESAEELAEEPEEALTGEQLAERLLKSLEEFGDDQRRILELSNQLARKPVDDFTDADEKKLQDIIDTEKKWTEFFQEAATDLSKLPPQDHSLAAQAKEFLEVYSEVQQAAEQAERKAIELAVPHEQAATELAESIETNLEKWLMETKDDQLWSMEDPLEDYQVPMVELPDELQDLIGDLVESEEDMLEEFDDVTSGWFDSLDIGAGWDTMDGPISNMSAKGVTGNRLPNTQEVGGRSGEGRTGRSSGQFVEEVATGKGGRQTPSRLTPDPFEAGWVEDTSAEAPTGATGGGKVSGQGAEGFQGPIPPALQQELNRMAVQQQELIDQARRLDYGLKKYRYPRGRLPETIELMEAARAELSGAELSNFGSYQRIVLSNLREVKELTDKQKQLWRDRSALLPKQLRDEITAARDEQVPEQYREMVRNYFRALSEAGTAAP